MRFAKNESRRVGMKLEALVELSRSEAIVTLAESEWNEARSVRGTIPPT